MGTIQQANLARRSMDESNLALQRGIALQLGEAYLTQLDLENAYPPLQEAARLTLAYGDLPNYTVVCCRLASLEKIRGRLGAAEKIYQDNLAALDQPGWQEHPIRGMVTAGLADVLRERGALEAAHQMARQAVAQTQKLGKPYETLNALTILARTLLAQGQLPGAGLAIEEALALYREYAAPPSMVANLEAARLRLWLSQGELEAPQRWMEATRERAEAAPLYAREVLQISFARLLLAQANAQQDSHARAQALALLEQLAAQAEAGGRVGRQVEILALQALALAAQGREADALRSLSASLDLAEPHGYMRTYLDEGAAMGNLLSRLEQNLPAGSSPAQAEYLHRLLSCFPNLPLPQTPLRNTTASSPPASPPDGPIEALTPRERDVLELVCAGLSNQEIAERLFLSLNTVKRHNNNLFGKLGVSTRAQAILRAQELGLDKAPDSINYP